MNEALFFLGDLGKELKNLITMMDQEEQAEREMQQQQPKPRNKFGPSAAKINSSALLSSGSLGQSGGGGSGLLSSGSLGQSGAGIKKLVPQNCTRLRLTFTFQGLPICCPHQELIHY